MRTPHILLNPGHDIQLDSGAVNGSDTEARIVEMLGYSCVRAFGTFDAIHPAFITIKQSDDLEGIVDYANTVNCDLFLSLHMNSSKSSEATGTEAWHYPKAYVSASLASKLSSAVSVVMPSPWLNRGAKSSSDLFVLRSTIMPAVLLEVAFISNDRDLALVKKYTDDIALAIVRSVLTWWYFQEDINFGYVI